MRKILGKTQKSKFHFDNHKKKKTDNFRLCITCSLYIRKLNELHENTPTHKKSLE